MRSKVRAAAARSPASCAACAREQQRERLARRDALGLLGELPGGADVAGADRDQALRDRAVAAHAAPGGAAAHERAGRAHDRAHDRPQQQRQRSERHAPRTTSTITEVSMRRPCQVMTTSPGRSASHTAANASSATTAR